MRCSTGKVRYTTRHQAEETLLHLNAIYRHPGPKAIYLCEICGDYHLTSKGENDQLLNAPKTKKGLDNKAEADFWERKLK